MALQSKQSVNYSLGGEVCGVCEHFQPDTSCELVAGDISAEYWCKLFERLKDRDKIGIYIRDRYK